MAHGGQPVGPVLEHREIAPRDRLEDVEAHPPVLVELVDLEQPELLQRPAVQALALGATVGSRVGEAVVEAFVADRRPEQGLDLEQAFPIPLEQPIGRGPVVSHRSARSRGVEERPS